MQFRNSVLRLGILAVVSGLAALLAAPSDSGAQQRKPPQPQKPPEAPAPKAPAVPPAIIPSITLKLQDRDFGTLSAAGINHFDACKAIDLHPAPPPGVTGPTIVLKECETSADGQVAIQIHGFDIVWVGPATGTLDDHLTVQAFQVPYPASWQQPAHNWINVKGGKIKEVRRDPVRATQGFEECSENVTVTTGSLMQSPQRRLRFPDPPCVIFKVVLPQPLAKDVAARIVQGCTATPVDFRNGEATCWWRRNNSAPPKLRIEWGPAFDAFDLDLTVQRITQGREPVRIEADEVLQRLRPIWPYAGKSPLPAGEPPDQAPPAYNVSHVEYFLPPDKSCGKQVPGTNDRRMPTLAEANCTAIPVRAVIAFTRGDAVRGGAPAKAFKPSLIDRYDIAAVRQSSLRAQSVEDAKEILPVRFKASLVDDYKQRFGAAFQNNQFPGVWVRSGDSGCARDGSEFVYFEAKAGPEIKRKWPVRGQVIAKDVLSDCATAMIEEDEKGIFLTFALRSVKAAGLRRLIVIARGPNFDKSGLVQTVEAALNTFVELAQKQEQAKNLLAPVEVLSVSGEGEYLKVFTGEQAALEAAQAKRAIVTSIAKGADDTPNLKTIENLGIEFDRIIIVMHGGDTDDDNLGRAGLMAKRYAAQDPGRVTFLITSDACAKWLQYAGIRCEKLGQPNAARDVLNKAFQAFLVVADATPQGAPPAAPASPGPGTSPPATPPTAPPGASAPSGTAPAAPSGAPPATPPGKAQGAPAGKAQGAPPVASPPTPPGGSPTVTAPPQPVIVPPLPPRK